MKLELVGITRHYISGEYLAFPRKYENRASPFLTTLKMYASDFKE